MGYVGSVLQGSFAIAVALISIMIAIFHGPPNRLSREVLDVLDQFLDRQQGSLVYNLEHNEMLQGIFAPVTEELPDGPGLVVEVVEGTLPPELDGIFVRIGPNPWGQPTKRQHVFDGDGMIHTLRVKYGRAVYHNAWLQTPRFKFERERGGAYFNRIGELNGLIGVIKAIFIMGAKARQTGLGRYTSGVANTAVLALPNGRLWALNEQSAPFEFKLTAEGGVSTVGFNSNVSTQIQAPVSAHPKVDGRSGNIFVHSPTLDGGEDGTTFLKYSRLDRNGEPEKSFSLEVVGPSFNHDIVLTENHILIMDSSVRFTPERIVNGGSVFTFNENHSTRIGVVPRNAAGVEDVRWFDLPRPVAWVHPLHGWEEEGNQTLKLWAPLGFKSNKVGGVLEGCCDKWYMSEMRIDLRQIGNLAEITTIDPEGIHNGEFSRLRDDLVGTGPVTFGYTAVTRPNSTLDFDFDGFTKWDMKHGKVAAEFRISDGWVVGEPVFVPKPSPSGDPSDDGFIASFLYGPGKNTTDFALWDARSFSKNPVVRLRVPRRVPVGFHGAWVSSEQLAVHLAHA